MFQFPPFASLNLCIQSKDILPCSKIGCPIRTSSDHSIFGDSPKLIAANHVLLRRPPPRHPPYTLSSLTKLVILVSDFSKEGRIKDTHLEYLEILLIKNWIVFADRMQLSKSETRHFRDESKLLLRSHLCGDEGDRTPDPRLAKPVLSQLSYIP
jgi:hypothetical protein